MEMMDGQIRMSLEDLFAILNIWKRADPTTTNRNTPSMIGPICIFYYFFCISSHVPRS